MGALARAQATMLPYYYGDIAEAVRLAVEAQELTAGTASSAAALGAAAEARAAARLGDTERALEAMENAERSFEEAADLLSLRTHSSSHIDDCCSTCLVRSPT